MWFAEMGNRVGNGLKRSLASETEKKNRPRLRQEKSQSLGILSFETAKTMSRLVSLYRSLTNEEFLKLRKEIIRSEGVASLISKDEEFLITLAWTEKIEDMDRVANAVARLGKKCSDPGLTKFELVYTDLKLGFIDFGDYFDSKEIDKTMDKMEKFISSTAELYSGLEALAEMEISERKLKHWKYSGPIPTQKANYDLFDQKISWQRQRIRHLRGVSLWGQTFNKTVSLMIRTVCIIYARLCVVFSPYISVLPRVSPQHMRFPTQMELQFYPADSCPVYLSKPRNGPAKDTKDGSNSCPISDSPAKSKDPEPLQTKTPDIGVGIGSKESHHLTLCGNQKATRLIQQAGESTVGGSGLGLRYANLIIVVYQFLNSPESIDEEGRVDLYQMLPVSLRRRVDSKLKELLRKDELGSLVDESVVGLMRNGSKRILEWLAPMAHDMVRWKMERNVEKQSFDPKPKVLLLQTLYFADREKAEAAIAEVLVGLNCAYRYEIGRKSGK